MRPSPRIPAPSERTTTTTLSRPTETASSTARRPSPLPRASRPSSGPGGVHHGRHVRAYAPLHLRRVAPELGALQEHGRRLSWRRVLLHQQRRRHGLQKERRGACSSRSSAPAREVSRAQPPRLRRRVRPRRAVAGESQRLIGVDVPTPSNGVPEMIASSSFPRRETLSSTSDDPTRRRRVAQHPSLWRCARNIGVWDRKEVVVDIIVDACSRNPLFALGPFCRLPCLCTTVKKRRDLSRRRQLLVIESHPHRQHAVVHVACQHRNDSFVPASMLCCVVPDRGRCTPRSIVAILEASPGCRLCFTENC